MRRSDGGGSPLRLLAVLAVALYIVVPVRLMYSRVRSDEARADRVYASAAVIARRASTAERADVARLRADLDAIAKAMPSGAIDAWIDAVSGLARSTGTTWRSATVTTGASDGGAEPGGTSTSVTVVVEGPTAGVLAFVDQLRVAPGRLTVVDEFAINVEGKDGRRATVTLKVRLLSFVMTEPPPPEPV